MQSDNISTLFGNCIIYISQQVTRKVLRKQQQHPNSAAANLVFLSVFGCQFVQFWPVGKPLYGPLGPVSNQEPGPCQVDKIRTNRARRWHKPPGLPSHPVLWEDVHDLLIDLRVVLEGIPGQADPLIADCPHDHVLPVICNGGHRNLHHHLRGVGQESLHGQELAQLPETLPPLNGRLQSPNVVGVQELDHLICILLELHLVLLHGGLLAASNCAHHQRHLTPNAVELFHRPAVAIDPKECGKGPRLGLP